MVFISESNVYRLIAHSKLPVAEKFESWIYEQVVPSVINDGGYINPNATSEQISIMMDRMLKIQSERDHYMMVAKMLDNECSLWKAHCIQGEISDRNGLPRLKRRRGTYYADRKMRFDGHDDMFDFMYGKEGA